MRREIALQLHLHGFWEGGLHLVGVVLERLLGLRLGGRGGDVDEGVVLGLGRVDNQVVELGVCTGQPG